MTSQGYFGYPNLGGGGGGLANTFTFLTCANETSSLPDSFQLIPGTGIAFTYGSNSIVVSTAASGGGGTAGNASKYILQQPDATLPNSQALSSLSTGLLKSTTSTGVVSIGVSGTDYFPPGTAIASNGGTGTSTNPTAGQILIGNGSNAYVPALLTQGSGIQITSSSGSITIASSGALGGTVQSVSIGNLSPLWTSTVGNPTTTPSATFSLVAQPSAEFYAGPSSGANSNPSFRTIQGSDIFGSLAQGTNITLQNNGSTVTITAAGSSNTNGTVTSFSDAGLPTLFNSVVANPTTTPSVTNTFVNQSSSTLLAGPISGAATTPTFRGLVGSDVFSSLQAGSNITLSNLGSAVLITSTASGGGGGSGTVTNVAVGNFSPLFTTTTGNPTTTPSTTFSAINQASALIFCGPDTGSAAAPTFRLLEGTDLLSALTAGPNTTITQTGSTITIASTASGGGGGSVTSVSIGNLSPLFTSVTSNPTTTPSTTYTLVNQASSQFYSGPLTGANSPPTFRPIGGQDISPIFLQGTNITLTPSGSNITITAAGSSNTNGTVTNIAQTVPSNLLSVGGSPITTSGTLAISLINQTSGQVFASPNTTTGTPYFRNLIGTDISPALTAGTNVTITNTASTLTIAAAGSGNVGTFTSGNLSPIFTTSVANPVTAPALSFTLNNQASAAVFAGPISGTNAAPTWRALTTTDLPATVGTVQSVAQSVPAALLSVSGSPITTSGTLAISLLTQASASAFLGPSSGANATPTFRAIQTSDLPSTVGTVQSVAQTVPASIMTVGGSPITTSGTLAISLTTQPSATFWGGPSSGANATPTFRAIQSTDLPAFVSSVTNVDGTLTISPNVGAVVASIATSAALPGNPTTTTQSAGNNTTRIATTSFVTTAVNNAIAGVNPAVAVQAATATILPNSPTYTSVAAGIGDTLTSGTNSVLVVDGYTPFLNDRILVKNQASAYQNGIYFVSQLGVAAVLPWIMTRALDYDQPSDINNTGAIPVTNGTVNIDTSWVLTSQVASIGPSGSSLTYTQFTLNPTTILTGAGNLSPLFTTTSGSNNLSFSLTNAAAGTVYGNFTGSSGAPSYNAPGSADQILGVAHTGGGLEYKTITAGSNITITPTAGVITIASTGGASTYSTTVQTLSTVTLYASSSYLQEINASAGPITVDLLACSGNFIEFLFARTDNSGNTITITASGADLIYGPNGGTSSTFTILGSSTLGGYPINAQGSTARFTSNGTSHWYILS